MANTLTISLLSKLRCFCSCRYINNEIQCTQVPVVTDKRNVHEGKAIGFSIIIVVPRICNEEKQGFALFNKCPVLLPIVPIVKLVKLWVLLEN